MPASSLFAEMERPTSTPNNNLQNSISSGTNPMDDNVALQIALELSKIQFSNDSNSAPSSEPDYGIPGLVDAERAKKSQNMTECVAVPSSEHVAEIVGRQGCKIKALRAKTNTYIKTPVRGEEPVFVVTGRKEDVGSAKREILSAAEHFSQIRACRKNNLNGSMAPGPPTNVPGQITIQVRVPYRVVGLVVGPKGATIKRIQQTTHTYIVTPSRDKEPVFEVTGLPDSVDQARKEIEAHIAMRTGGALDGEGVNDSSGVANRHDMVPNSLNNLFSNNPSDLSSLYKMNSLNTSSLTGFNNMGLSGLNGTSSLSSLNGLNQLPRSLSPQDINTLHTILDNGIVFGFKNNGNSLGHLNDFQGSNDMHSTTMLNSKLDNSLFSLGGSNVNSNAKLRDMSVNGLGGYYGVDEGLGSLGSSMGSSPSFDPAPSSIWGDLGRSLGPTLASSNASSLSSNMSSLSLTRRSSSVSGASPPSSRLSPTFESHPPARRISSDPASGVMSSAMSSSGSSPASTPELGTFNSSSYCMQSSALSSNMGIENNSSSSSPTPAASCEKRCRACSDAPIVAALVPCGHNLFCMDCALKMADEQKCAICFAHVSQAIRIRS